MHLNIHELLEFAKQIAIEAGHLSLKFQKTGFKINHKNSINNLVTEADLACEKLIIEKIKEKYPTHCILAEESGACLTQSKFRWIIDPIDGTTNFAHQYPFFATSIALEYENEIIIGITHAPMLKETFYALKNDGAFLNDTPIKVSKINNIELALLGTGFPSDLASKEYKDSINIFTKAQNLIHGVRRAGSACLDLAYTACGRLDGFFEIGLQPWDTATGTLLVTEAGGTVSTFKNTKHSLKSPNIVATNKLIHTDLISCTR